MKIWTIALAVAFVLSAAHLLDGPSDPDTDQAVADDVADAQKQAVAGLGK
jgi:hypothetical protein